ncbi:hypothetical protein BGZ98_006017, partial [Dissophora globulifera]
MGATGLWPWTKSRGYAPSELILGSTQLPDGAKKRVDLAGGYYPIIRRVYGSNTLDDAHAAVEWQLKQVGKQDDIVVYIDGEAAEEKRSTHTERAGRRAKALDKAEEVIDMLDQRISSNNRVSKNQISKAEKHLMDSFSWSSEAKDSLVTFLRTTGWQVIECGTEADIEIARDCGPKDIVVTRDSDFIGYATVKTIWRLIGKRRVLQYSVESLLAAIKLTRAQLTVLCIVSHNDYSKNIHGLGPETNYKNIKNLEEQDVPNMVQAYLEDDRVMVANAVRQE